MPSSLRIKKKEQTQRQNKQGGHRGWERPLRVHVHSKKGARSSIQGGTCGRGWPRWPKSSTALERARQEPKSAAEGLHTVDIDDVSLIRIGGGCRAPAQQLLQKVGPRISCEIMGRHRVLLLLSEGAQERHLQKVTESTNAPMTLCFDLLPCHDDPNSYFPPAPKQKGKKRKIRSPSLHLSIRPFTPPALNASFL